MSWKQLHNDFHALKEAEDRIVQQREGTDYCYAYVTVLESGELGRWIEGTTESLQVRFESLATDAGIALRPPPGISPLEYLLHRLVLNLRANKSPFIHMYSATVGVIERLFEATAIFCARLDREWLEKTVIPGGDSTVERTAANRKPVVEPERRRGYRTDVRKWMKVEQIPTVAIAAKRIGISQSALKSMMSARGKPRYGEATLTRILGIIGYKGE